MAARRWAAKAEAEAAAVLEEASVEGVPVELLAEAANPPPRLRATPIPATPTLSPISEPERPRSVVVERIPPSHTPTPTETAMPVDMALWVLVSQNGDERFVLPPDNNWQRAARW